MADLVTAAFVGTLTGVAIGIAAVGTKPSERQQCRQQCIFAVKATQDHPSTVSQFLVNRCMKQCQTIRRPRGRD